MVFSILLLNQTYWNLWCALLNASIVLFLLLSCCPVQSPQIPAALPQQRCLRARFFMLLALTQYLHWETNLPFSFFKALEGEEQFAGPSSAFFFFFYGCRKYSIYF